MRKLLVALCLFALLGGCASYSAVEPQNRQQDSRLARIYFIRQSGLLSSIGKNQILVDGKLIGSLDGGTLLVADRPPGPHVIALQMTTLGQSTAIMHEAEIQTEPGKSYYFEIGKAVRTNIDIVSGMMMGSFLGTPLQKGRVPGHIMFYTLEESVGAGYVARMRPQG